MSSSRSNAVQRASTALGVTTCDHSSAMSNHTPNRVRVSREVVEGSDRTSDGRRVPPCTRFPDMARERALHRSTPASSPFGHLNQIASRVTGPVGVSCRCELFDEVIESIETDFFQTVNNTPIGIEHLSQRGPATPQLNLLLVSVWRSKPVGHTGVSKRVRLNAGQSRVVHKQFCNGAVPPLSNR